MSESKKPHIKVLADFSELDTAIEKANRLVGLLREALDIINSFSTKNVNVNITHNGSDIDQAVCKILEKLETGK